MIEFFYSSILKNQAVHNLYMQAPKEIVLAIPDLQCPFEHVDALSFVREVAAYFKPTKVVCLGDEADQHALSQYEADPDGYSAGDEADRCVQSLKEWYKYFPVVDVCISNHTDRIFRKAFKAGIPKRYLKDYREFLEAPRDWRWADYFVIDNVRYEHGDAATGGAKNASYNLVLFNGQSTVHGHIHSFATVQYIATPRGRLFGVNSGCLINEKLYAFGYAKRCKHRPVLGCTIIDRGVPQFIPMQLDRHERWIGEI